MNKLILFFTIIALSFGCTSSDSTNSNNNNGNSFTNSMDYEFTITINGEVNKISGNTTNGLPIYGPSSYIINNECDVLNAPGKKVVTLEINDVTATNYISGQNLNCQIELPNLLLGVNQATVSFNGSYFQTVATSLGSNGFGFVGFQTTAGPFNNSNVSNKLPITITDLGTTSNMNQNNPLPEYNFGQTLKGHYSGTIYLIRNSQSGLVCDVPVQITIDFKALRTY